MKGRVGSFAREFKEFAARGNVVDLAVGVVIGAAFGRITSSLVDDIFMPIFGALFGSVDFSAWKLVLQPEVQETVFGISTGTVLQPEIAINIGSFFSVIINFLLVAFAMFLLVKGINRLRRQAETEAAAEPLALDSPAPIRSPEELLLIEIRDLLKSQVAGTPKSTSGTED